VEFENDSGFTYATLGMSFQNMPGVELHTKDAAPLVRTEIITRRSVMEEDIPGLLGRMAVFPWLYNRHLSHLHTYESGMTRPYMDFLLVNDFPETFLSKPDEFIFEDHKINFLMAVPLHQEDKLVMKARGNDFVWKKFKEKAVPEYRWP